MFSLKKNDSFSRPKKTEDRPERGRLSRAVGSYDRNNLGFLYVKGDAVKGLHPSVVGIDLLNLKHLKSLFLSVTPQIGLDHAIIALHFCRGSSGNFLAIAEDEDPI